MTTEIFSPDDLVFFKPKIAQPPGDDPNGGSGGEPPEDEGDPGPEGYDPDPDEQENPDGGDPPPPPPSDGGEPGEPGEGEGEPGEPGEGEGKGKSKGKPGDEEGEGEGSGEGEDKNDDFWDAIDKESKKIEEKMKGSKDVSADDVKNRIDQNKGPSAASKATGQAGKLGADGNQAAFDYSQIKPTYSWKQILENVIRSSTVETEETYVKLSKKSSQSLHIARQLGAAAAQKGELPGEDKFKVAFVVDSSGSMGDILPKVYATIDHLLKNTGNAVAPTFYLIKFSNTHHVYRCNLGKKSYVEVANTKPNNKVALNPGNIKTLFSTTFSAGTVFSHLLVADCLELLKQDFNIIICSDSDITAPENFSGFLKVRQSHKDQVFMIASDHGTYVDICKLLGQKPKTMSHF